jgi:hypothetical protein
MFDEFEDRPWPKPEASALKDRSLEWAHYEFDRNAHDLQRPNLKPAEMDELCVPFDAATES